MRTATDDDAEGAVRSSPFFGCSRFGLSPAGSALTVMQLVCISTKRVVERVLRFLAAVGAPLRLPGSRLSRTLPLREQLVRCSFRSFEGDSANAVTVLP